MSLSKATAFIRELQKKMHTCLCYCPHLQSHLECESEDPPHQTVTPGENIVYYIFIVRKYTKQTEYQRMILAKTPCFPSYLAHISDGVIKNSSCIVSSLSDKLDLPGS